MQFEHNTTLLNAAEATGAGPVFNPPADATVRLHATISNTATVKLQGSIDGTTWFDLYTVTATEAFTSDAWPYLRGNVTAYTSGTVTLLAAW